MNEDLPYQKTMLDYVAADTSAHEIKKLGFGLMRLPKIDDDNIDIEQTRKMVDLFMDARFTYFDTAWAYAGSEDAIRQALVERYPRESFKSLSAAYQDS